MWFSIMNVLDCLQFYVVLSVHMCLVMMESATVYPPVQFIDIMNLLISEDDLWMHQPKCVPFDISQCSMG